MPLNTTERREPTIIRVLGACGVACTVVAVVAGVAMLLMTWATGSAPILLTRLSLFLLPLGFLMLIAAIAVAGAHRRRARSQRPESSR